LILSSRPSSPADAVDGKRGSSDVGGKPLKLLRILGGNRLPGENGSEFQTPNWLKDFATGFVKDLSDRSLKTLVALAHTSVGQTVDPNQEIREK